MSTQGSGAQLLLDRVVEEVDEGLRLDQLLAGWISEPRSRSQERISAGDVAVDGEGCAKSRRVRAGERITVQAAAPPVAAPTPGPVPIRFSDEHLLVVAKPAGLVVHRGAGTNAPTLVDALRAMTVPLAPGDDPDRPGIVHRLDRGTSGILVVAKTDTAREGLIALFSRHEVDRVYWALTEGVPDPPRATIDAPIGRAPVHRTRFIVDRDGRPAVSHYDLLVAHDRAAEVAVRLETGRTHQVRVHMSAVGHPIVGDSTYGAGTLGAELGLDRPALHARLLGFTHPITAERVEVIEPLPADLSSAVAALAAQGRSGG
jgi:23S rRNA pseudouridine1911/1915/1917 synthase